MPAEGKDLGYTEWTQLSTQFSQKMKSLAVKKNRLEGPAVCSSLLFVSLLSSVKLGYYCFKHKIILWWSYNGHHLVVVFHFLEEW